MCLPLIFIVLQVIALENMEAIPVPYYSNILFYDPWYYQYMMMKNVRSPYQQTTGPVSFGGQVKAKGEVTITGGFGNDGNGSFTTYSAPLTVTSQPVFPTTSTWLIYTTLPTITTLPPVTLPCTTADNQPFIDNVPSTVSVPTTSMPFIVVTTTVPNDVGLNGNVANSVKFGGMVPASGSVKISAHFC